MIGKLIELTPSAYDHPLLIGGLLKSGVTRAPEQEIVYADRRRMTYRELGERVGRLASALAGLGVRPGDTVGVMDWDTTRYLECFFAVPMMGAVLHTVNVRLSPEQMLYTINHAEDDVILVNSEFCRYWNRSGSGWIPGKTGIAGRQRAGTRDAAPARRRVRGFAGPIRAAL